MLTRIVTMHFKQEHLEAFFQLFKEVKPKIEASNGCQSVTLFQDMKNESTVITYSIWNDEAALEAYRQSGLFLGTWAKTKVLFSDKPSAISLRKVT